MYGSLKKTFLFLLALLSVLSLTACGRPGHERTLSEVIEAIENYRLPGLQSEPNDRIDAAAGDGTVLVGIEDGSEEDEAEAEAEALRIAAEHEAAILSLTGEWSELSDSLPLFRPIISWYGDLVLKEDGTYSSETTTGTWELNADRTQLTLRGSRGKTLVDIVEDGNYMKLSVPELHLNFLRSGELKAYINERFVTVRVNLDNVENYIGRPVNIGVILDEKDKPTNESAWVLSSPVYESGLVYYGRSENFYVTIQNNATGSRMITIPYDTLPLTTGATFGHFTEVKGTLVYIRAEYVAQNRMTDARTRTLTFTDGTTHTTSLTWYSDLASYSDWCF